ncbi:hypothetical protein W97_05620 [Neofusicoccum parvum]|nr:hypothetical protein W97_05620 [Neofusicoccum parvum]
MLALQRKHDLGRVFYLDLWPFSAPILVIGDPEVGKQVGVDHYLHKPSSFVKYQASINGWKNLLTQEGSEWKQWRTLLNPGFQPKYLMQQVPGLMMLCERFCKQLEKTAETKTIMRLEVASIKLAIEVIGLIGLGQDLQCQTNDSPLVEAFMRQTKLLGGTTGTGIPLLSTLLGEITKPFKQRRNTAIIDAEVGKMVDEHFAAVVSAQKQSPAAINLALETFASEKNKQLDAGFRQICIDQFKTFLFNGHDTSSTNIAYAHYALQTHPAALSSIRAEHDRVFGPSPSSARSLILARPHLLNQLPYTLAVIKECLRLWPPAAFGRSGAPGVSVHHGGATLPTEGCLVYLSPYVLQRQRRGVWGADADAFRPERWLERDVVPFAWVPFGLGPRVCIGQELALLEMKLFLVMTVRAFDLVPAYDEVEELWRQEGVVGRKRERAEEGGEAYQVFQGTAKPAEGMPVRVHKRFEVAL